MNDSNTFVQICGATLSKVKKALKNDQYRYDGVFPELDRRDTSELQSPQ